MSRSRIIYSVVIVLLGAAAIVVMSTLKPEGPEEIQQRLIDVEARLRSAGSAQVTFTAEISPQVVGPRATLQGTSMIKFGVMDQWDTTYSSIVANGAAPIQAHAVHVGQDTYFSSPRMVPEDGRPWFSDRTAASWGSTSLADPKLGLTDFTVWARILGNTTMDNAFNGRTDDLPDVKGADHEYRVRCTPEIDPGCPPPFGVPLDDIFDQVPVYPVLSAWIDDDGLLRKLTVVISLMYRGDGTAGAAADHPSGEYIAKLTFTLDKFGTPVTVTAPPKDQISESQTVGLQG